MHELSLAQELVEQVCRAAKQENAKGITTITVVIGAYSGVERDAFEFAFPLAAEQTLAEGAILVIEEIPAHGSCSACHAEFKPLPGVPACPLCNSDQIHIQGGRELLIQSIELLLP